MTRRRLAVFSPVRPVPSGISDYTESFLLLLAGDAEIDLFLDGYKPDNEELSARINCRRAEEYQTAHENNPYDLNIYQIGNAPCHDYILPFLYNHPGLMVLHDASLHGTRLDKALDTWTGDYYRAEMRAAYGEQGDTAAELALTGLHNQLLLRYFPMIELQARASLMTVVHEEWLAEKTRLSVPGAEVRSVPFLIEKPEVKQNTREEVRAMLGLSNDIFLIGSFGMLTPDKRIQQLLEAFKWLLERRPRSRCMLAGDPAEDLPIWDILRSMDLLFDVICTERLPEREFYRHMAACDAVIQLRWPTRRETSAVVMQEMSLGLPVIVSDLAHMRDYPEDALIRISVEDEERALRRALLELAETPPLRREIGDSARAYVEKNHNPDAVRDRWLGLIDEAITFARTKTIDKSFLPAHLTA